MTAAAVTSTGCTGAAPLMTGQTIGAPAAAELEAIRDCAASFAAADDFSGVVLVEHGGRRVLGAAYGLADPERGVKNRLKTPFNTASVGKLFTATAIGQLVDAGKLDLEDPVGRYLPELPPEIGRITVARFLNHSSGIGEIFTPANTAAVAEAHSARELLPLVAAQPLAYPPGSRHAYSNTGFVVLGAVVEAITGQDFASYAHEHIFRPAGMTESSLTGRPATAARMLTRSEDLTGPMLVHSDVKLPRRPVPDSSEWGGPYGNGYNSAEDLARFARAIDEGRLLSKETRARLWSDPVSVPGAGPGQYAYGFQVSTEGGVRTVGHSGLRGGANAEFLWAPEAGWTVVVLSNYDPMAATVIGNAARLVLTRP